MCVSLDAAAAKLANLDRMQQRTPEPNTSTAELGIPIIKDGTQGRGSAR